MASIRLNLTIGIVSTVFFSDRALGRLNPEKTNLDIGQIVLVSSFAGSRNLLVPADFAITAATRSHLTQPLVLL